MVRPKKYGEEAHRTAISFYIHPTFIETFKKMEKLCKIPNDDFSTYLEEVEGEDIRNNRIQGLKSAYIRFLITTNVMENMDKV